jgi:hypothetical protein
MGEMTPGTGQVTLTGMMDDSLLWGKWALVPEGSAATRYHACAFQKSHSSFVALAYVGKANVAPIPVLFPPAHP